MTEKQFDIVLENAIIRKNYANLKAYKDHLFAANQELGKKLKEAKEETKRFRKLYDNCWHQNQSLLDMRSENLSFLITVKPNNIKRKKRCKKM